LKNNCLTIDREDCFQRQSLNEVSVKSTFFQMLLFEIVFNTTLPAFKTLEGFWECYRRKWLFSFKNL